jgi:hypothetical protein
VKEQWKSYRAESFAKDICASQGGSYVPRIVSMFTLVMAVIAYFVVFRKDVDIRI